MKLFSTCKSTAALSFLATFGIVAVFSVPAWAAFDNSVPGTTRILGTGEGLTPGLGIQDSNWTIQSFPTPSVSNAPASVPVSLYIPNTTAAWYQSGTSTTSTTNPGVSGVGTDSSRTYYWGTSNPNNNSTSIDPLPGNPNYSYVVSTTFEVATTGTYSFTSNFSADNRVSIFLGGTLTSCDASSPLCTVTGGTQLGASTGGPSFSYVASANGLSLNAGETYTLNYVVTDFYSPVAGSYGSNGLLVSTTFFTEVVPGPLPIMGASVFFAYSRKIRRKIKSVA